MTTLSSRGTTCAYGVTLPRASGTFKKHVKSFFGCTRSVRLSRRCRDRCDFLLFIRARRYVYRQHMWYTTAGIPNDIIGVENNSVTGRPARVSYVFYCVHARRLSRRYEQIDHVFCEYLSYLKQLATCSRHRDRQQFLRSEFMEFAKEAASGEVKKKKKKLPKKRIPSCTRVCIYSSRL